MVPRSNNAEKTKQQIDSYLALLDKTLMRIPNIKNSEIRDMTRGGVLELQRRLRSMRSENLESNPERLNEVNNFLNKIKNDVENNYNNYLNAGANKDAPRDELFKQMPGSLISFARERMKRSSQSQQQNVQPAAVTPEPTKQAQVETPTMSPEEIKALTAQVNAVSAIHNVYFTSFAAADAIKRSHASSEEKERLHDEVLIIRDQAKKLSDNPPINIVAESNRINAEYEKLKGKITTLISKQEKHKEEKVEKVEQAPTINPTESAVGVPETRRARADATAYKHKRDMDREACLSILQDIVTQHDSYWKEHASLRSAPKGVNDLQSYFQKGFGERQRSGSNLTKMDIAVKQWQDIQTIIKARSPDDPVAKELYSAIMQGNISETRSKLEAFQAKMNTPEKQAAPVPEQQTAASVSTPWQKAKPQQAAVQDFNVEFEKTKKELEQMHNTLKQMYARIEPLNFAEAKDKVQDLGDFFTNFVRNTFRNVKTMEELQQARTQANAIKEGIINTQNMIEQQLSQGSMLVAQVARDADKLSKTLQSLPGNSEQKTKLVTKLDAFINQHLTTRTDTDVFNAAVKAEQIKQEFTQLKSQVDTLIKAQQSQQQPQQRVRVTTDSSTMFGSSQSQKGNGPRRYSDSAVSDRTASISLLRQIVSEHDKYWKEHAHIGLPTSVNDLKNFFNGDSINQSWDKWKDAKKTIEKRSPDDPMVQKLCDIIKNSDGSNFKEVKSQLQSLLTDIETREATIQLRRR